MYPDKIILVRHGETDWNKDGRFLGQSNPALNNRGIMQARAATVRWAHEKIDWIFCSSLLRTMQTAHFIAAQHNKQVIPLSSLKEIDFGVWEGLKYEEIQRAYPHLLESWIRDSFHTRIPEAETATMVWQRVQKAWNYIKTHTLAGDTVLIVTHGGPLSFMVCCLGGLNPEQHNKYLIKPGESIVLKRKGRFYFPDT